MAPARQESLISRNHSTTIKGVLMLLIILGHNAILLEHNGDFTCKEFLYTFHVWGFFMLPFLYPIPKPSIVQLKKYFKRLIIPYSTLFLLFLLVFCLHTSTAPDIKETLIAFISASQILLKTTIGFRLLWFLPTMFLVVIARDAFFHTTKSIQISVIAVCIVSILYSFIDGNTYWKILYNMPLGMIYLPRLLLLGILTRLIISFANDHISNLRSFLTAVPLASLATILFFSFSKANDTTLALLNSQIVLPISYFYLFHCLLKNVSITILSNIGHFSFSIYIIHQPVYNILFHLLNTQTLHWSILGTLVLLLTIILSYLLALLWNVTKVKIK